MTAAGSSQRTDLCEYPFYTIPIFSDFLLVDVPHTRWVPYFRQLPVREGPPRVPTEDSTRGAFAAIDYGAFFLKSTKLYPQLHQRDPNQEFLNVKNTAV